MTRLDVPWPTFGTEEAEFGKDAWDHGSPRSHTSLRDSLLYSSLIARVSESDWVGKCFRMNAVAQVTRDTALVCWQCCSWCDPGRGRLGEKTPARLYRVIHGVCTNIHVIYIYIFYLYKTEHIYFYVYIYINILYTKMNIYVLYSNDSRIYNIYI